MLLDGKALSNKMKQELKDQISTLVEKYASVPTLSIVVVGSNPASEIYVRNKVKSATNIGMKASVTKLDENVTMDELIKVVDDLNNDKEVNGIMVQLPLPKKFNEENITNRVSSNKDVDGLTSQSLGNLMVGSSCFVPCTPKGIVMLLKAYGVDIAGKNVCIINRSNIVGKPLEQLFLMENATTTVCHSKTLGLADIVSRADIVVAALNKKEFITADFIKDGAIVIDVGVHRNDDGKTVGDVKFDEVYDKCSLITPPTGGVGPMTICMLCYNSVYSVYGDEVLEVLERGIEKVKVKVLEK